MARNDMPKVIPLFKKQSDFNYEWGGCPVCDSELFYLLMDNNGEGIIGYACRNYQKCNTIAEFDSEEIEFIPEFK